MDVGAFIGKLLEQDDVDVLREGVLVLAQLVMDAEVSPSGLSLRPQLGNLTDRGRRSYDGHLRRGGSMKASRPASTAAWLAALCTMVLFGLSSFTPAGASGVADYLGARFYDGAGNGYDAGIGVVVSPDGSHTFVTGPSAGSGTGYEYATVAYDTSTMDEVWSVRFDGFGSDHDIATGIAISPDGTQVYVTGYTTGYYETYDYGTVAYDASDGSELWVARFDGENDEADDLAAAITVSPDGSDVFVTGQSFSYDSGLDFVTVAYDAATGSQSWATRYDGPGDDADRARAISVSSDGTRLYVTGDSFSGDTMDYATVAYEAVTGAQVWAAYYNGRGDDYDQPTSIAVSPNGSAVYITGESWGAGNFDWATVAYEASSGTQSWAKRYKGSGNGDDVGNRVAVNPEGTRVLVTGYSVRLGSGADYTTIDYDAATGVKGWASRYNGPGNQDDHANAMIISPDGTRVWITGESVGSDGLYDYATISYRVAAGDGRRLFRFSRAADTGDAAYALAISPDGSRLFVTGSSGNDFGTVFYGIA